MILFIWSQHGPVRPIMKITLKSKQSDEIHYYKLNWAQIIRHEQMIFQYKYFNALLRILICIFFIKQVLCIYGETSHLESYKST